MYDIKDAIIGLFSISDINILEFGKHFKADFTINGIPDFADIKTFINSINYRDVIQITLIDIYDEKIVLSRENIDIIESEYASFLKEIQDDDNIKTIIEINKNVKENHFTIYNWESFSTYLIGKNIYDILSSFNYIFDIHDYIYFEVLDKDIYWNTKTMVFSGRKDVTLRQLIDRNNILKNAKEVSHFYTESDMKLIADDFIINNDYDDNPFTEIFGKISTLLCIGYISNQATLIKNVFKCQITGQRNINYEYDINNIVYNKELIKIYEWMYSNDNMIDKAIISRNIISLHCKYCDLLNTDEKTFSSIQSNYRIYLKNNVNKFLEAKQSVSDFICKITMQIGDDAFKILSHFKTNIFAIFGILLTVVISNIVAENPLDNIFTEDIVILLKIILCGSIVYFAICLVESLYKYSKNKVAYQHLKDNYSDIFLADDFENIFESDKKFNKAKQNVITGIFVCSILWVIVIIILFYIINLL